MRRYSFYRVAAVALLTLFIASCRGTIKEKPPIHPNLNMDQQDRKEAMEVNSFFDDNRAMRQPVEGTVASGYANLDSRFYEGKNPDSSWVSSNPHPISKSFVKRGQKQYEIYCTPCHGGVGDGQGIVMVGRYGYVPAPTYHSDRLRNLSDGELYSAIANGVRSMPSYATQIETKDRWAIVSYIRALQKSQYVTSQEIAKYDVDTEDLKTKYRVVQEKLAAKKEALDKKKGPVKVSATLGKKIYTENACQTCHSQDGSAGVGPTHKGLYNKMRELATGETVKADEEYLYESIVEPNAKVVKGYPAAMASYDYLSEAQIKSLVEYIKTL